MIRSSLRLVAFFAGALAVAAGPLAAPLAAQYYGKGPQLSGEGFGKNKIQYRDFDWQIYRSPHFNVYYYEAEEAQLQKVVSFAESGYDQLSREFNFQIKDPVPLIFYSTHSAFEQNNIILNFIPEGVGAFASPVRFRMVLPVDLPDPELMQLILHELTHIFQYHMLFQGSLAKAVATAPPTWFMEGMASYMAKDETERDKMFLRDAVVNDRIPPVTQVNFGGFFAYRFGHAVFDFIEERWGRDGFLDFIYEIRNTIGSRVDRAVERAFKMKPEDFDAEFRRWLRRKYLPQLVETGEPGDFGRVFRLKEGQAASEVISPTASPSGDLVAAFTVFAGEIDISLFNTQTRRLVRNLTEGFTNEYQYLVGQELALGRKMGRDIDFSPDGNTLAVFAKREKGRSLVLLDVLNGGIREVIDMAEIEQQTAPSWSPDGTKIAFSGWKGGQFDIFLLDVESKTITNFTNDDLFDGAPDFSPDGRSLIYVSVTGNGFAKIFRSEIGNPGQRFQITTGESNENDPIYSTDGRRIYFTSDQAGADNIFGLDLAKGEIRQYTDVVTGAFMPTVLPAAPAGEDAGRERVVYTGFWKGNFDLYITAADEPVEDKDPQTVEIPAEPTSPENVERFEPDIQVTIDEANKEKYGGYKFFLEDAQSVVGVDADQTLLGQVVLTFSDYLGDRRILAALSSVESFSNFNILYADFSRRWQWQVLLFDDRSYYLGRDFVRQDRPFERVQEEYQVTGAIGSIVYPFTFYQRAELGLGYIYRQLSLPVRQLGQDPLEPVEFVSFEDNFPLIQGALVGDSTIFANWGAIGGRRWRLDLEYAPNVSGEDGEDSTLFTSADLDVRQYIPVTRRSNLALRGFAGIASGERPTPFRFGGLDTLRGVRFFEFAGDRAFFANIEYRFPLIDLIATPVFVFQGVRGVLFFDVGGAWYDDFEEFDFYNSDEGQLEDALAAYGFGLTVRFVGLDLNWDFAQVTRFADDEESGFETSFWIGRRF